jgi:hypothetical protein
VLELRAAVVAFALCADDTATAVETNARAIQATDAVVDELTEAERAAKEAITAAGVTVVALAPRLHAAASTSGGVHAAGAAAPQAGAREFSAVVHEDAALAAAVAMLLAASPFAPTTQLPAAAAISAM